MLAQIFQTVKGLTFTEVVRRFHGEPGRGDMILCPFHPDRAPSFRVYQDGGYCFGCAWRGDGVDFVAALKNVSKIEAARLIGQAFNLPVDRRPTRAERQRLNELQRARQAAENYRAWEDRTFRNLASLRDYAENMLFHYGLDVPGDLLAVVHKLELVKYWLEIFIYGSIEEKFALYHLMEGGEMTKWLKKKIWLTCYKKKKIKI